MDPQIGVSAYRIDLGIVHPDEHGRYLAGVECDGAMYHSSAFARERDKIRQGMLEKLGWTLFRIWSTDWWQNKAKALENIDRALRRHLQADRQHRAEQEKNKAETKTIDQKIQAQVDAMQAEIDDTPPAPREVLILPNPPDGRQKLHITDGEQRELDFEQENAEAGESPISDTDNIDKKIKKELKSLQDSLNDFPPAYREREIKFPPIPPTQAENRREVPDNMKFDTRGKVWWQPKGELGENECLMVLVPEGITIKSRDQYLTFLQQKIEALVQELMDDPIGMTGKETPVAAVQWILNETIPHQVIWQPNAGTPKEWAQWIMDSLEASDGWTIIKTVTHADSEYEKVKEQDISHDAPLEEVLYTLMAIAY